MDQSPNDKSVKAPQSQPNNPLHGIKLADMLSHLETELGWEEMGLVTGIKAFDKNPSHKSALNFLRKTPWAREKIEALYLRVIQGKHFKRNKKRVVAKPSKKFPFLKKKL